MSNLEYCYASGIVNLRILINRMFYIYFFAADTETYQGAMSFEQKQNNKIHKI